MFNCNPQLFKITLDQHKAFLADNIYYSRYINVFNIVNSHFADINKTKIWIETPNSALGDIEPFNFLYLETRYEKLLKFIKNQLDGNIP